MQGPEVHNLKCMPLLLLLCVTVQYVQMGLQSNSTQRPLIGREVTLGIWWPGWEKPSVPVWLYVANTIDHSSRQHDNHDMFTGLCMHLHAVEMSHTPLRSPSDILNPNWMDGVNRAVTSHEKNKNAIFMNRMRCTDCQMRGEKRSEPIEPKKMLIRGARFAYIACQTYWQKCQKLNEKNLCSWIC